MSVLSSNAFACKPINQITGDSLFYSGIISTLKTTARFGDYEIKRIEKLTSGYQAYLLSAPRKECLKLVMSVYGIGSCDFKANILKEKKIKYSECH